MVTNWRLSVMLWMFFSPQNWSLFWTNWNWSANEIKPLSLSDQLCLQDLCIILVRNEGLSIVLWTFFSHRSLSLFWQILNCSANESKPPFIARPIIGGKVLMFGNCLALCSQHLWIILVKNEGLSITLLAFFSHRNLSLFWKNLNWSANESKAPFVVRPITRGKVLEMSPWRVRGGSAEGKIWEKVGSGLSDIEIGSAKIEVWLYQKKKHTQFDINKSINQL